MLPLSLLAKWTVLAALVYALLGRTMLNYNENRGDSMLGFLLAQGLSAWFLSFFI